ncbi:PucR family transcriptional regulator [Paenibacillus sp. CAU 1782]
MSTTDWLKPLQHILKSPVGLSTKTVQEWKTSAVDENQSEPTPGLHIKRDGMIWFVASVEGEQLKILEVQGDSLSPTELKLVGWSLQVANGGLGGTNDTSSISESEKFALKLSEWLQKQLEAEKPAFSLPDHLTVGSRLYHEMVPFLLIAEQVNTKGTGYIELEKLLRSFLSDEVLLIPLKSQEWLIWGPLSLLKDEEAEFGDGTEEESVEDSLASIASGLHEMLASEWLGECHLAVTHPVIPSQGMVETTLMLRETINLGRKFHVGTNIHLPWMLQLERLLNAIPELHRSKYLEQSLKRADLFVDTEMQATLDAFFSLDCNVSETAKKLYIHRNTLLYRLDKLKQETGLDVRQFRDAVLVKIILLLYKVTKRN